MNRLKGSSALLRLTLLLIGCYFGNQALALGNTEGTDQTDQKMKAGTSTPAPAGAASKKFDLQQLGHSFNKLTACFSSGARQNNAAFDACINRYTPRDLSDAEARNIAEFVILDLKSISLEPCPAQAQIQQRFKFQGPYACFEVKHRAGPSTLGLVEFSLVKGNAEPKIRSIRMSF